ncbi:iron-dicitrate transporter permease subunit [Leucothrix sargassi]|nr:iron-dicitrate transporter permease subunit [Leucothrix sargassi]
MKQSYFIQCVLLCALLLILSWISLFAWSAVPVTPMDAINALVNMDDEIVAHHVVWDIRVPRLLTAILVGASLAMAGAIMQALTQNPLASPSVLGINAGAALGMATVSTITPWLGLLSSSIAAMIGGGVAWVIVMLLGSAWKAGGEHGRLVLAGIAVSALCAALTKAMVILAEDQASAVMAWLAGSLASASWEVCYALLPFALIGLILTIPLSPILNLFQLGEDNARNLGVSLLWTKLACSLLVLLLVGGSLAAVGSMGFIGLLVPHIARMLCGYDHRKFMPLAMLIGACLVIASDIVSRSIVFPTETPAGALLALFGAPFFIYLVRKRTL